MNNYKKFMAQVNERIEKSGKKPTKSEGGIMARKERDMKAADDYVDTIASYIAIIRKTAQKVKAKNAA